MEFETKVPKSGQSKASLDDVERRLFL